MQTSRRRIENFVIATLESFRRKLINLLLQTRNFQLKLFQDFLFRQFSPSRRTCGGTHSDLSRNFFATSQTFLRQVANISRRDYHLDFQFCKCAEKFSINFRNFLNCQLSWRCKIFCDLIVSRKSFRRRKLKSFDSE